MILIVGGLGSGKRSFITDYLGYAEQDVCTLIEDDKPVVCDLHEYIRESSCFKDEWFDMLLTKQVVSCNEVGSGVVPMDASERKWRDEVGRASTLLASKAEVVVRMVCGLPQVIKGDLP